MGKRQLLRICFKLLALPGGQEVEGVRLCSPLAFPLWQALGRLPFSPSEHPRARWFNESKPHTAGFRLRLWLDTDPLFGRTGAGTKGLAHGHLHAGAAAVPVPQSCQGPGGTSVSPRRGPEWKSGTRLAAVPRRHQELCSQFSQFPLPLRLLPPRRNSRLVIPEGRASREPRCAGASFFRAGQRAPPPFSNSSAAGCRTVVRMPSLPSRFPASVSPQLSRSPLPSLPDGLLCGSAESPTPFLCGITMAAGVSLPALAIRVTLSDAILYPSGARRRQRSSGAAWSAHPGSRDRTVGE